MAELLAISALWSLPTASILSFLDFVVPEACSEGFRVRVNLTESEASPYVSGFLP